MIYIDKYYERAMDYLENDDVENAITTFISGLEHGHVKCAFGPIHTLMRCCSYTMTEDEAISIFTSSYLKIKLLAQNGDTEAMVMVAEGIRYGFVEDDDEPYFFWLVRAAELGDKRAIAILEELDVPDNPWPLPGTTPFITAEARDSMDATDLILLDDHLYSEYLENITEVELTTEEDKSTNEPDYILYEELGINAYLKEKKRQYELRKCRDDQAVG